MNGLHFNIFYFSNYIFVLAILPLVVLARGTEAWEPTPEHISVSLRWIFVSGFHYFFNCLFYSPDK